jgi:urea carboxylase
MTFHTLLVADRGETAARVVRTARDLGLRTVAVHGDADRSAPHVQLADEAVRLGPASAGQPYPDADLILRAAKDTGAGAVHPGCGMLSRDAAFARRCEDAGFVFVGPTPEHLELFGAKHTARAAAEAAGLPLAPGTELLTSLEHALREAGRIGYPVMLKPAGGGTGMSACRSPAELTGAWQRRHRAASASGPSTGVFLERLVEQARHVEVQVFGDGEGLVVTFGDRDRSLRRHGRTVLAEAPAPRLPDHVRAQLAASARDLCAWVDYRSAGTVEFLYDAAREQAYFVEVSAGLRVGHPVTEEVHGVDLVAWMLRLARGERGVVRAPGPPHGHAVEARLYPEGPTPGRPPGRGPSTRAGLPPGAPADGRAVTGTGVTTSYDPVLAGVIVHGCDREEALRRLAGTLAGIGTGTGTWAGTDGIGAGTDGLGTDGIGTGLDLLRTALTEPSFRAAAHTTTTLAALPGPPPHGRDAPGRTRTRGRDEPDQGSTRGRAGQPTDE